ncbi:MAG: CinA family nicotinamide mononucleotide deamidase-related protein [Muribaculum sp.]|nr:CinA family nicotinamide mononucleotide deamidase-related protein [Muribaculum sp.]
MNISIIAIGTELLIGQVIDTNSGDIARKFAPHGWRVNDVQVVDDDAYQITRAIERAFESSDVVITTGGLGPTKDDITKSTLRDYFGGEMQEDQSVLENIKRVFEERGLTLNALTAQQAVVPTSCKVIQNTVGTAPIMWFEKDSKVLVSMPGVPFETREMLDSAVIPALLDRFKSDVNIEHRCVLVTGYTESLLAMTIAEWEDALPSFLHLAYLPKPGLVRLRIDGVHHDKDILINEIDRQHKQLCDMLGDHVLCDRDTPIEALLIDELRARGMSLSTAESCTGGNIAHVLTEIPGCSDIFNGGLVAYSNQVKENILGVSATTLERHGAVSEEVVKEMVTGACKALNTDCAIATSGIAGPGGGTAEKPVGTVCIGVKTPDTIFTNTYHFPGTRQRVIERATMTAIVKAIELIRNISI